MFGVGCVYVFAIIGRKNTPLNNQYLTSTLIKFEDLQWTEKNNARICQFLFGHLCFHFVGACFGFYRWSRLGI